MIIDFDLVFGAFQIVLGAAAIVLSPDIAERWLKKRKPIFVQCRPRRMLRDGQSRIWDITLSTSRDIGSIIPLICFFNSDGRALRVKRLSEQLSGDHVSVEVMPNGSIQFSIDFLSQSSAARFRVHCVPASVPKFFMKDGDARNSVSFDLSEYVNIRERLILIARVRILSVLLLFCTYAVVCVARIVVLGIESSK